MYYLIFYSYSYSLLEVNVHENDPDTEVLLRLRSAILDCNAKAAAETATASVERDLDPILSFNTMAEAMTEVGARYEAGDVWLPELVSAAAAMQAATPILEAEIQKRGATRATLGTVVAGTVAGDIHSIGVEMVCTLLIGAGFEVHYLGIDVSTERFIEAIKETHADILAMTALLSVTAVEQKNVIDALVAEGLRDSVKVMVGGAAVTADYAEEIGADGYDYSAAGAAVLAKRFLESGQEVHA
jgi:methanogenic corrinoid protein MtbC1